MIDLCARVGYQHVSVADVSSRAGVSSATFYEQFEDKEDCLVASFRAARTRVFRHLHTPSATDSWTDVARDTLGGLFRGLQTDSAAGRLVFVESLAGGERVREERERALGAQERIVEDFLGSRPSGAETLDIPVVGLEGARRYIVSRYLRMRSEDLLPSRVEEMVSWMGSYAIPANRKRWSTGAQALLPALAATQARPPDEQVIGRSGRLPRGRHGLPPSVVARSQRNRIIAATADVMTAKGYANTTVAEIVAAAGVSRDVFYDHFKDKQDAFLEAQQFATQAILNTCAAAYFSVSDWPERVWRALDALLSLIAEHPAIAHLRLVECYAGGEAAIRSIDESVRAATVFLEEGFSYREANRQLPRLYTQATSGAILEICSRSVARGESAELPRYLPQLTYIALAPFMGAGDATEAVSGLIAERVR
jgi:AcrR family transcriptional regulator